MLYKIDYNIGKVKYLVSYSNGIKKHKDGSEFWDIACFKNKKKMEKFTIIKHHLYLKQNGGKILKITRGKHTQLHNKAYEYIYKVYGKKGINKYLKWFDKYYKLKSENLK